VPLDAATLKQAMLSHGVPEGMADVLVGSDLARKLGQFGPASTDVLTLTGRPPMSVRALLESQRQALLDPRSAAATH
jgi:hypothetical protein